MFCIKLNEFDAIWIHMVTPRPRIWELDWDSLMPSQFGLRAPEARWVARANGSRAPAAVCTFEEFSHCERGTVRNLPSVIGQRQVRSRSLPVLHGQNK